MKQINRGLISLHYYMYIYIYIKKKKKKKIVENQYV
jgi:hypothetical protein